MIYKIKRYEVPTYNGYFTLELPKDSDVVGVIANNAEPGKTPIQLLVEERVGTADESPETREVKLLVVADGSPYGDALDDDEFLMYLGHAMWDNGYRINYVFEVIDDKIEREGLLEALVVAEEFSPAPSDDLKEAIDNLEKSVVELDEEPELQNVEKASDYKSETVSDLMKEEE